MAAVEDGKCVDTSMGFTPLGGLGWGPSLPAICTRRRALFAKRGERPRVIS